MSTQSAEAPRRWRRAPRGRERNGTKREWYKGRVHTTRQQGDCVATKRALSSAVPDFLSAALGRQVVATPGMRVAQKSQQHVMRAHRRRSRQHRSGLPGQPKKGAHSYGQDGRVIDVRSRLQAARRPRRHTLDDCSPPVVVTPHATNPSPSRQPQPPNIHLLPPPRRRRGTQPSAKAASKATSAVTDGTNDKQRKNPPHRPRRRRRHRRHAPASSSPRPPYCPPKGNALRHRDVPETSKPARHDSGATNKRPSVTRK